MTPCCSPSRVPNDNAFSFRRSFLRLLRESVRAQGVWRTLGALAAETWEWTKDLLPERRRARFGDIDFDLERGVDTTRAHVSLLAQLKAGLLGSRYFPTDPYLFDEMMSELKLDVRGFTFIDLGCGKGRALLLASDHPFAKIVGVELVPEWAESAREIVAGYKNDKQQCRAFEIVSGDARDYEFPSGPLFVYLFNPFPETVLAAVLENLQRSLKATPRAVYVAYRLPELETVLSRTPWLEKVSGTEQWTVWRNRAIG